MHIRSEYQAALRQSFWLLPLMCGLLLVALLPPIQAIDHIVAYLPFHMTAEMFACIVSASVFTACWSIERQDRTAHLLLIAYLFLSVAIFDMLHMLSIKGMPDFFTPSSPHKGIAFWLMARLFAAAALLCMALQPLKPSRRPCNDRRIEITLLALTGLLGWIGIWHSDWIPNTFEEGQGLTPFKIASEALLVALYLAAATGFLRQMRQSQSAETVNLFNAACIMALSEIFFCFYSTVSDINNVLGHIYKIVAYIFVFRGIVIGNIRRPYQYLKASAQALRASEDRLRLAGKLAGIAVWEWDASNKRLIWDDEMYRMFGTSPHAGKSPRKILADAMPPDELARHTHAILDSFQTDADYSPVYDILWPDGSLRRIETAITILKDDAGRRLGVVGINIDITEREHREAQLRILSAVSEQSPLTIAITDLDGRIVYTNPHFTVASGFTAAEALGKDPRELQTDQVAPEIYADLWQTITRGKTWHGEVANLNKSGELYWEEAHVTPVKDASGAITHYAAVKLDITERKQQDAQLRILSTATEQSPLTIVITDLDARIQYTNPHFTIVTGYTAAEALGKNPRILQSGQTAPETYEKLWQAITHGENWCGEILNRKKSGELYWEEAHIAPVKDESGITTHYVAVKLDITKRKQAEADLRELNEQLESRVATRTEELDQARQLAEAANRAKSEFLANMSHEIRTPLNAVIGMTQLIERTELTSQQQDYVGKIEQSGEHLLSLINTLLDFAKIEAGRLELEYVAFKPHEIVQGVRNFIAPKAAEKGLRLTSEIGSNVPLTLYGDPLRLRQTFLNLAGNAVKFTGQGHIALRVRRMDAAETGCRLLFEVEDSGIGIDEATQARLFNSFAQADNSITRRYGGTGLGLAICKELAQLMGGEVGVSSVPGQGSTFWFTAVCDTESTRGISTATEVPRSQFELEAGQGDSGEVRLPAGLRILLAEDNPFNQQVACEFLALLGVAATVANNGREVLEWLAHKPFDVVLMDMQMPEMDGLEATRRIRAQSALADLIIIAMTANARREDRDACLAAGMDDFLTKPLRIEDLGNVIARHLRTSDDVTSAVPSTETAATLMTSGLQDDAADLIDLQVLGQMLRNDPAKIKKFAWKFADSAHDELHCLREALDRNELEAIPRIGHRMKAPARTVGATRFAGLAQQLEACSTPESLAEARAIHTRLKALLDDIVAHIRTQVGER